MDGTEGNDVRFSPEGRDVRKLELSCAKKDESAICEDGEDGSGGDSPVGESW